MNHPQLDQAREWAESIFDAVGNGFPVGRSAQDTAQFVKSLPDQIVDGGRLRQIIDFQGTSISDDARKDLESLLTPPLLTLADMTPEEAREHLAKFDAGEFMEWTGLVRALRTIAGMSEEVEYRIVDPDTNGGRYELRRWSRHVTEWSTDE